MKTDNSNATDTLALSVQDIASHKSLIDFDDKDAKLLKMHGATIDGQLDGIVEKFYERQMLIPEVSAVISVGGRLDRLKPTMKKYIQELFAGDYGSDYAEGRLNIGTAHENLGVAAKYYLSAVYQLENLLRETIVHRDDKSNAPLRSALHKIMQFDVQIVMDNFISNLLAKVKIAQDELEDYAEGLEEVVAERTRQLSEVSRKDELTELFNRDGMLENLRRELANAGRYKESISIVCFTLKGFIKLAEKRGQAVGNVVLNQIGHDIKKQIREADVPCRVADDEFCIIMPRTETSEAEAICKRIIELFKKDNQHKLSLKIGIATTGPGDVVESGALIKQVEGLMHKAGEKPGFNICTS